MVTCALKSQKLLEIIKMWSYKFEEILRYICSFQFHTCVACFLFCSHILYERTHFHTNILPVCLSRSGTIVGSVDNIRCLHYLWCVSAFIIESYCFLLIVNCQIYLFYCCYFAFFFVIICLVYLSFALVSIFCHFVLSMSLENISGLL